MTCSLRLDPSLSPSPCRPALVWADEPTGNLDQSTAAAVLGLLREVHAAGQTLVVVTHDPEIGAAGERTVLVEDGRVSTTTGTPTLDVVEVPA